MNKVFRSLFFLMCYALPMIIHLLALSNHNSHYYQLKLFLLACLLLDSFVQLYLEIELELEIIYTPNYKNRQNSMK